MQPGQEDIEYVIDQGLIRWGQSALEVSEGLCREVTPRQPIFVTHLTLEALVPPDRSEAIRGPEQRQVLLNYLRQLSKEVRPG